MALLYPRHGELRQAEWAEFDLDAAERTIPAGRTWMRRPLRKPLPGAVVAILNKVRERVGLEGRSRPGFGGRGRAAMRSAAAGERWPGAECRRRASEQPPTRPDRSRRAAALVAWRRWWARSTLGGDALPGGVVEAAPLPARGRRGLGRGQAPPARPAGVSGGPAGVAGQAGGGSLAQPTPSRGPATRNLGVQRVAHRPAHDLAGVRGARTAARGSRPSQVAHVGRTRQPGPPGPSRLEAPAEPARGARDRAAVAAVGGTRSRQGGPAALGPAGRRRGATVRRHGKLVRRIASHETLPDAAIAAPWSLRAAEAGRRAAERWRGGSAWRHEPRWRRRRGSGTR